MFLIPFIHGWFQNKEENQFVVEAAIGLSEGSKIISTVSAQELRTSGEVIFRDFNEASKKCSDTSVSSVNFSHGYVFPDHEPEKGPKDIRVRVIDLGKKDENGKKQRNWLDMGMFIRKMRPCKVVLTPYRKIVPYEDIEEIRTKMLDEKTTYPAELDFFQKEAKKDEFIKFFTGFKFNKGDYSGVKHVVFLSDLHLCSIGINTEKGLYEYFLKKKIKENFLKAMQVFQNYKEEEEHEGEDEEKEGKKIPPKNVKKKMEEEENPKILSELKKEFMLLDKEDKRKKGFTNDDILFVFLGDQVNFGNEAEFLLFKIFLQKMNMKNVCVIPGNHDNSAFFGNFVRSKHQCEEFSKILLGEKNNVLDTNRYYPKVVKISDKTNLILLDSTKVIKDGDSNENLYQAASGLLGEGQRDELKRFLRHARKAKKEVIVCIHHHPEEGGTVKRLICLKDLVGSLGGDTETFECFSSRLWDATEFLEILWRFRDVVRDVVYGHLHNPVFMDYGGVKLRCIGSLTENKWEKEYEEKSKKKNEGKPKKLEEPKKPNKLTVLNPTFKNGITCCFEIDEKKWIWT